MATEFRLTDPTLWEPIWDETLIAETIGVGSYKPIPRREIPILLNESVLAIGTSSATAPQNWRYAGRLVQRMTIPGVSSGLVDGAEQRTKLNLLQLAIFPVNTPEYRLAYDTPPWITNLSVSIWRYTGPEIDTTQELIETLKVDVARVEFKLNRLV
jgi:hypothetical protein